MNDSFCFESGKTYRPFKDPHRILSNDRKKGSTVDPRVRVKGVPDKHLSVIDFGESESKTRLTGKPKKTASKDQRQETDERISRDVLASGKSEDDEDFDSTIVQCDSSSDYSFETPSPTSGNSSPADEGYANLCLPLHSSQHATSSSSESSPVYGPLLCPQLYFPCSDFPDSLQGGAYPDNGQPEPIFQPYAEEAPHQDGMWLAHAEGHILMPHMEADISPVTPSSSSSWSVSYPQMESTVPEPSLFAFHEHSGYLPRSVTEQQAFGPSIASVHYNPQVAEDMSMCQDMSILYHSHDENSYLTTPIGPEQRCHQVLREGMDGNCFLCLSNDMPPSPSADAMNVAELRNY